jgi:hypothetical protein
MIPMAAQVPVPWLATRPRVRKHEASAKHAECGRQDVEGRRWVVKPLEEDANARNRDDDRQVACDDADPSRDRWHIVIPLHSHLTIESSGRMQTSPNGKECERTNKPMNPKPNDALRIVLPRVRGRYAKNIEVHVATVPISPR